jgi:anti-sigma regulatory factor (Ser/Thr protein kinase)
MSPAGTQQQITREYASELPALPLVRQQLDGVLDETSAERQKRWDVRLAVTEACSNVIRHAYPASGGTFHVSTELRPGMLEVIVRDAGRGAVGRVVPKLGMLLLYEASDGVALDDASPGLIVRMAFTVE